MDQLTVINWFFFTPLEGVKAQAPNLTYFCRTKTSVANFLIIFYIFSNESIIDQVNDHDIKFCRCRHTSKTASVSIKVLAASLLLNKRVKI